MQNRFLTVDETYNLLEKWGRMQQESVVDRVMIGNSTLGNPIYMYGITCTHQLTQICGINQWGI